MIIVDDIIQGSDEWFRLRLGNPGASNIDKVITADGKPSRSRDDYMRQLAGEIICGKAEESYKSIAMMNGNEREAGSRALFEMIYGVEVKQVALIYKDERRLYHCSPDGMIENACVEMKNPMMKTTVKHLLDGKLPVEYYPQCQMHLFVTGFETCYFMSHYEGLPPLIIPVKPDAEYQKKLEQAIEDFCISLADMVNILRTK